MASALPAAASRYLAFRVGSHRYALPATEVSEVIRIHSLVRVPQGPAALLGVANLRGNVVPVVGLSELLKHGSSPDVPEKLCLVLDQAAPAALVVDAVDALEEVAADRIERADGAWQGAGENILGAFKGEQSHELTNILGIDALLSGAFADRPSAKRRERAHATGARLGAAEQETRATEMLLTFEVGAQEFAFPLVAVEELLRLPASVSAISRTDAIMAGFTSIRDVLIPLLSLRGLLGFDAASHSSGREKVIVLKVAGAPVGLIADDARAVVAANIGAMEPVPAVLAARTGGESRIRAVYRGEGGRRLISILSPQLLFREDVMQRLAKVEQHVQTQKAAAPDATREESIFLVFRLGNDEFGLPIDSVVEVASVPAQITRVPKAPKFLEGVVNLRGDVLAVIDQRRRFEMPPLAEKTRRLVVVKTGKLRAGIVVDSVTDVLRTSAQTISPPPQLTAQISRLVHGVINLEATGRLVLLLDPTELLTRAERGQLDTFQAQGKKGSCVIKVLVVDDSALVRKLFGQVLATENDFTVSFARNGLEALEQLEAFGPDVVTLDVQMPHMNGLECLDRIMLQRPCPVVMVSTVTEHGASATLDALRLGAVDFVTKPSGAVSLHMEAFAPALLAKVRSAATAKLPASLRLKDRLQFRAAGGIAMRPSTAKARQDEAPAEPLRGDGLVLVGTSTGGPPALEALLTSLTPDFSWPILVAQHMPGTFTGSLARRLDGLCALKVVEAARLAPLEAGTVYIGRGDADIVVSHRASGLVVMTTPAKPDYPWHPSTDRLVRSALEHVPATQLIGILMTGMGNDGAAAMGELRSRGGRTIAEAEETAVVWGMPGELVRAGGATWTLPLPMIGNRLKRLVPLHAPRS